MNKNLNHFRTIHWNIEIIGTIRKRSDETIDIELDQKYAMVRERKKIEDSRKRKKKYRSQSKYPVLHLRGF